MIDDHEAYTVTDDILLLDGVYCTLRCILEKTWLPGTPVQIILRLLLTPSCLEQDPLAIGCNKHVCHARITSPHIFSPRFL